MWRLLLLPAVLLVSGCFGTPGTAPIPRVVVAPTGQATAAQLAAQDAQIASLKGEVATLRDLAQRASGAVFGATDANTHNPAGLPKEATAAQLDEATSALPNSTAEQKLEKANQNARILAGELVAVKAEMGQAISENQALKVSLAATEQKNIQLEKDLAAAAAAGAVERAGAAAALQKQFDAMSAKIGAAQAETLRVRDEERKAMLRKLGFVLLGLGTLFTLAGALQAYAIVQTGDLTIKGFLKPLVWAGAAAFSFGCYWTMNQPWFKWVVIIGGSLGVIAGVLFFYSEWQSAKEVKAGKERASEADEAEGTLKHIITVADSLPETASLADYKTVLAKRMSDPHKALIHELRAETKRLATP